MDMPVEGNRMGCVILGDAFLKMFYKKKWVEGMPYAPPDCYAIGRTKESLFPHQQVVDAGRAVCLDPAGCMKCENNRFETIEEGRVGKKCKDGRRLAIMIAGTFTDDGAFCMEENPDYYRNGIIGHLKVPITSAIKYSEYVKQVGVAYGGKRPVSSLVTEIAVLTGKQNTIKNAPFGIRFTCLAPLPLNLVMAVQTSIAAAGEQILSPFPELSAGEDAPIPF